MVAISSVMSEGLNGLQRSSQSMARSANDIARAGTTTSTTTATTAEQGASLGVAAAPKADIVEPLVNLKQQELYFEASAKVVSAADDMLGTLLETKA